MLKNLSCLLILALAGTAFAQDAKPTASDNDAMKEAKLAPQAKAIPPGDYDIEEAKKEIILIQNYGKPPGEATPADVVKAWKQTSVPNFIFVVNGEYWNRKEHYESVERGRIFHQFTIYDRKWLFAGNTCVVSYMVDFEAIPEYKMPAMTAQAMETFVRHEGKWMDVAYAVHSFPVKPYSHLSKDKAASAKKPAEAKKE